jgi:hypothetical protein
VKGHKNAVAQLVFASAEADPAGLSLLNEVGLGNDGVGVNLVERFLNYPNGACDGSASDAAIF